jgi:iron(II)-dependent oxidoreductase
LVVTEIYCNWDKPDRQRHPINCVSWDNAVDFANFKKARLPSESEWEYAARSEGQNNRYPWGNDAPSCSTAVMLDCGSSGTAEVCSKSPAGDTKQGLCDMAGNVEQWVQDSHRYLYEEAPADGTASTYKVKSTNVVRGGSFFSARNGRGSHSNFDDSFLRTDTRGEKISGYHLARVGFRLARSHR